MDAEIVIGPQTEIAKLRMENTALRAERDKLREAMNIDREDVGRIMHESWTRTKRAQGHHGPGEVCRYCSGRECVWVHRDLIEWDELPEEQKDINRHAFDDVLDELRRRAGGG